MSRLDSVHSEMKAEIGYYFLVMVVAHQSHLAAGSDCQAGNLDRLQMVLTSRFLKKKKASCPLSSRWRFAGLTSNTTRSASNDEAIVQHGLHANDVRFAIAEIAAAAGASIAFRTIGWRWILDTAIVLVASGIASGAVLLDLSSTSRLVLQDLCRTPCAFARARIAVASL